VSENIVTAKVCIKGTRPFFMHWFGPDAIPLDDRKEKTGKAGNDPEEWRRATLLTKDGQLWIPGTYAFATIREGARYTKKGRGSIQNSVIATLQILDDRILIDRFMPGFPNGHSCDVKTIEPPPQDQDEPVYLDVRMCRNPSTKAANIRYRVACAPGWQCSFTVQFDKSIVSRGEMEACVIDAGKLSGIGNGRKIGMGRFELVSFDVQE
jgi:hypothetical protein